MSGLNFSDDMTKYMGPGLGGIMMGNQQRQAEDQRAAQTQQTLQQIMESQGREGRAGQEMEMRQAQEARAAAKHPFELADLEQRTQTAKAEFDRKEGVSFLDDFGRFYDGSPESETKLKARYPKQANHDIWRAAVAAHSSGKLEDLKNQVAGGDMASRDTAAKAKATSDLQTQKDNAAYNKEVLRQDQMTLRTRETNESKEAMNELRVAADKATQSGRLPSANQVLGRAMQEVDEAVQSGNPEQIRAARNRLIEKKNVLLELAVANTDVKGENATNKARALLGPDLVPPWKPIRDQQQQQPQQQSAPAGGAQSAPSPQHIQTLKSNPNAMITGKDGKTQKTAKQWFDEKYGAGAADAAMGAKPITQGSGEVRPSSVVERVGEGVSGTNQWWRQR